MKSFFGKYKILIIIFVVYGIFLLSDVCFDGFFNSNNFGEQLGVDCGYSTISLKNFTLQYVLAVVVIYAAYRIIKKF